MFNIFIIKGQKGTFWKWPFLPIIHRARKKWKAYNLLQALLPHPTARVPWRAYLQAKGIESEVTLRSFCFLFKGYYAFIETSSPRRPGDKARLLSQQFNGTNAGSCFTFWYHMYGVTIGTLNLYQVVGQNETLIWTLSGNKGNSWFSGQVSVGKKLLNGYKVCEDHVVWNKRTSYSISFKKNREGSFIWLFSHHAGDGLSPWLYNNEYIWCIFWARFLDLVFILICFFSQPHPGWFS